MGFKKYDDLVLGFLIFACFISSSCGHKFFVGGENGWVPNPTEEYNKWAERNRFQVNDTILFKYKEGTDSVLGVSKADYDSCNTKSPIFSLTQGNPEFLFGHSGPFFFISGNPNSCQNGGQKLIVVVMAVRNKPPPAPQPPHHQSPSPSPAADQSTSPAAAPPGSDNPFSPAESPAKKKNGAVKLGGGSFRVLLGVSVMVSVVFSSFLGV